MNADVEVTGVLAKLRLLLEGERGPLARALLPADGIDEREVFAPLVAAGDRVGADGSEYALLVESILEGYLLHYGFGRVLEPSDSELRLLAGDYLYAFGLERLARLGDLEAVDELSDLISLCAQAHSLEREPPWRLTSALWALTVLAIAAGRWSDHEAAKRLARVRGKSVSEHVRGAAIARAESIGLRGQLERALIAFERTVEDQFSTT